MSHCKARSLFGFQLIALAAFTALHTFGATPVSFECTVRAESALAAPVFRAQVNLADLRGMLSAPILDEPFHVVVTDSVTLKSVPAVCVVAEYGMLNVLWHPSGTFKPGDLARYSFSFHKGELSTPPACPASKPLSVQRRDGGLCIDIGTARVIHDLKHGGTMKRIEWPCGKAFDMMMYDRLHSNDVGAFSLSSDPAPQVEVYEIPGWFASVHIRARYMQGSVWPASHPTADLVFAYHAGCPFVQVGVRFDQETPQSWDQLHVLQLQHRVDFFKDWAMAEPLETGPLDHPGRTHSLRGRRWGALFNETAALGMTDTQLYGIHDNLGKYGIYLHGPWLNKVNTPASFSARLYVGASNGNAEALAVQMQQPWPGYSILYSFPKADKRMAEAEQQLTKFSKKAAAEDTGAAKIVRMLLVEARRLLSIADLRSWRSTVDGVESLLAGNTPAGMITAGESFLKLSTQSEGCAWISRIADLQSSVLFVAQDSAVPLWTLQFREKASGEMFTLRPLVAPHIKHSSTGMTIEWKSCSLPNEPGSVDVRVTESHEPGSSLSRWRIAVKNRSASHGLWEIEFPRVEGLRCDAETRLVVPRKWGTELQNPAMGRGYNGVYPAASANMQFLSYSRQGTGLYLAAHDPGARIKRFSLIPQGEGDCAFTLTSYPDDMGVPGLDYEMQFDAVIATHAGGWFEAAKIYRAWAVQKAPWCSGGPVSARTDIPQWFKECSLCYRPGGAPEQVIKTLRTLHQAFGLPAVVHWYQWHQIPFDNDYPEYFPVKPGFTDAVSEARGLGLRVMPYVNGRLWDSDTESWNEERAVDAVAINQSGESYFEHWSKQNHGVMCPSTDLWQNKMRQVCEKLSATYGCSGVYLDQIGAAVGQLCFSSKHGHPNGGAAAWWKGEMQLLSGIRQASRVADPDFIMTTEDNAECYIGQLDGCLMCNAEGPGMVPLFAAVYGGYTLTFGRSGQLNNPDAFAMQHGQAFVFGSMMGRVNGDAITRPDHADKLAFLKHLTQLHSRFHDFLALGEMLTPPELRGDIPEIGTQFASKSREFVQMSTVQRAVWSASDRRLGVFLVNIGRDPVSFDLVFDGAKYGLSGKLVLREYLKHDTEPVPESLANRSSRRVDIGPWSASVFVIESAALRE